MNEEVDSPNSVSFVSQCPKGHAPTLGFNREDLLGSLENGSVRFWCNLCGDSWPPSDEEKRRLKDWLSRQAS